MVGSQSRKNTTVNQEGEIRIYTSTQEALPTNREKEKKIMAPHILRGSIGEKNDHPTSFVLKSRHENTAIQAERD